MILILLLKPTQLIIFVKSMQLGPVCFGFFWKTNPFFD